MTTNTNPSRTTARFFASTSPNEQGLYTISDRVDPLRVYIVAAVKGRAAARTQAATLTAFDPAPRPADEAKPAKARKAKAAKAEAAARTSHTDCAHASTKLARAICRRERAKADVADTLARGKATTAN